MGDVELSGGFTPLPDWVAPEIDQSVANPARIYDHLIGGKDNFAVDRAAAAAAIKAMPQTAEIARANRAFLGRSVRFLAERGIDQFLDIGAGIPGPGSTGEVARGVLPRARVAYVDNDPVVVTHTRALGAGDDPSLTAVVVADVREPESILENPDVRAVLDFDRPIGVLMVALLHFVGLEEDLHHLVARYMDAVVPGSALVVSHITPGGNESRSAEARKAWTTTKSELVQRTEQEVGALFDGLDVVEPGVVQVQLWHPDATVDPNAQILMHGGVGFKP